VLTPDLDPPLIDLVSESTPEEEEEEEVGSEDVLRARRKKLRARKKWKEKKHRNLVTKRVRATKKRFFHRVSNKKIL